MKAEASKETPKTPKDIGYKYCVEYFGAEHWSALETLWANESGWTTQKWNYAGSKAYGIPQALPASKMASEGSDYMTNPDTQIRWGVKYIQQRYGTPSKALAFWKSNNPHWY